MEAQKALFFQEVKECIDLKSKDAHDRIFLLLIHKADLLSPCAKIGKMCRYKAVLATDK